MEMREWVERLMGLGPEWRIERVDEDSERQEARVVFGAQGGPAVAVPGVRARVSGLRRATPGVAGIGRMGIQDVRGLRRAPGGVSRARGGDDAGGRGRRGRSRYTAAFELLAIGWLREASVLAVSRLLRLSWTAVAGIMERAVRRGLARRGG